VEISTPSSSPSSSTNFAASSSYGRRRKPLWLWCVYVVFGLVCWNAAKTYQRQKELVLSTLQQTNYEESFDDESENGISYSAGAEEHVISANYGSSMYGGGIHTSRAKPKKTPTRGARMAKLQNIYPKPSDGKKDFNVVKKKKIASSNFNGFSFYVMTDTPYNDWQEKRLRSQMADLRDFLKANPTYNMKFGVHLGNTQKVSNSLCSEASFERISYLISKGPRPTLVVPGNQDWFDCPRRKESFDLFLKFYGPKFITNWHSEHYEALAIKRSKENPELFVFYVEGILFIGVHLLHAKSEEESSGTWDARMKSNMEWVAESVETYCKKYEIRGAVVMGHAARTARTRPFFSSMAKYFAGIKSREKLPVMYLHGDGLKWQVDKKFAEEVGWNSYTDVQIHQSGLADPVRIDVAPQKRGKLESLKEENKMQTVLGNGLFRIDQGQGVYSDPMDIPKMRARKA